MKQVLIIEDDTTLREGICLAIQSAEINTLQAGDLTQSRDLLFFAFRGMAGVFMLFYYGIRFQAQQKQMRSRIAFCRGV